MEARDRRVSEDILGLLRENSGNGTVPPSSSETNKLMHQIDLHISARCQGWQEEVAQLTKQLQHSRLRVTQLQKQLLAKSAKLEEVERTSQQRELEYQSKMADCEAQLLQLRTSLNHIHSKYSELRQKRYSRGSTKHKSHAVDGSHIASVLDPVLPRWNNCDGKIAQASHISNSAARETRAVPTSCHTRVRKDTPNSCVESHSGQQDVDKTTPTNTTHKSTNSGKMAQKEMQVESTVSCDELVDRLVDEHIELLHQDLLHALSP